ncbi:uncharacterized protein LOC128830823 [Malaclemys terrapin pileata]|uniref:uncharacterized protein LOC128830823 n=1 Tax=Malaclemys terrapin pileata TaxID=2991368 RepID=UPI0023A8AF60|nr:uncharacterized protein LOC128830823 [Malaclemys terrapin pileata]
MFVTLDLEPVTPELTQDPQGTQETSAANVSPSQRLVNIRKRKRRTRDDMFTELQMSSHADRAQQNAWRQSMSEMRKAQYEREERWRAESRDEQSKWRAEDDRWRQLADRWQEAMLRLLEHQTDMLERMAELQERQQDTTPGQEAQVESTGERQPSTYRSEDNVVNRYKQPQQLRKTFIHCLPCKEWNKKNSKLAVFEQQQITSNSHGKKNERKVNEN